MNDPIQRNSCTSSNSSRLLMSHSEKKKTAIERLLRDIATITKVKLNESRLKGGSRCAIMCACVCVKSNNKSNTRQDVILFSVPLEIDRRELTLRYLIYTNMCLFIVCLFLRIELSHSHTALLPAFKPYTNILLPVWVSPI